MQRTFKYKLEPTSKQREALFGIFDFCRFLYNNALEERISYYKLTKTSKKYTEQSAFLPEIKRMFPNETSSIYSQTLQQVLKQLDLSIAYTQMSHFPDYLKYGRNRFGIERCDPLRISEAPSFRKG